MTDSKLAPYGVFVLRAALGAMFIAHAYLKLFTFTVPGFEAGARCRIEPAPHRYPRAARRGGAASNPSETTGAARVRPRDPALAPLRVTATTA